MTFMSNFESPDYERVVPRGHRSGAESTPNYIDGDLLNRAFDPRNIGRNFKDSLFDQVEASVHYFNGDDYDRLHIGDLAIERRSHNGTVDAVMVYDISLGMIRKSSFEVLDTGRTPESSEISFTIMNEGQEYGEVVSCHSTLSESELSLWDESQGELEAWLFKPSQEDLAYQVNWIIRSIAKSLGIDIETQN